MISRSVRSTRFVAVLLAVVSFWGANSANAQTMVGLGALPGATYPFSSAAGVSADGLTVVGVSKNSTLFGTEAFIWTKAAGMVGLGNGTTAAGVSGDGSVVVGEGPNIYGFGGGSDAGYIWTATTGLVGLGGVNTYVLGVSADGSIVVGYSMDSQFSDEAFVWRATTGIVLLGALPNSPYTSSAASAVSSDGSTVVGVSYNSRGIEEPFVWTASTGMVGLGSLPNAHVSPPTPIGAYAVSANGSTVVGSSYNSASTNEAFIWTAATGMVGLGTLPNASYSRSAAYGVSADGSVVGGESINSQGATEAFVWTAATGMVGLGSLPGALNPYSSAKGVSANGRIVVGTSSNSQGLSESFILDLTPPNPADLIIDLIQEVASVNLQHGIENSLDAKLDAAFNAFEAANAKTAINNLNAFISAVKAQSGKQIPTADANSLIAAAQRIIGLLQ